PAGVLALIAAGHLFLGGGLGVARTPTALPSGGGPASAWSFDLAVEGERFFLLGKLQGSDLGGAPATMGSIRAGGFLTSGNIAPYLAAGAGSLALTVQSQADPNDWFDTTGLAFAGEAGVAFFRDFRYARVAVFIEWIQPTFDARNLRPLRIPIGLIALRAQFGTG